MVCHLANDNLANDLTGESYNRTDAEDKPDRYSDQVDTDTDSEPVHIPEDDEPSPAKSRGDEPDKYSEQLMHSRRIPVSTAKSARSTSSATTSCGGGVMMKMQDVAKPAISSGKCPFHHLSMAIINSFDLQNRSVVNTFLMA